MAKNIQFVHSPAITVVSNQFPIATASTTGEDWRRWCRLCAEENAQDLNVLFTDAQLFTSNGAACNIVDNDSLDIVAAIEKHFWINITRDEELSKSLCSDCFSLVTSLMKFSERVTKVQELYHNLQHAAINNKFDLNALRISYGLLDTEHEHMHIQQALSNVTQLESKPELIKIVNEEDLLNSNASTSNRNADAPLTAIAKEVDPGGSVQKKCGVQSSVSKGHLRISQKRPATNDPPYAATPAKRPLVDKNSSVNEVPASSTKCSKQNQSYDDDKCQKLNLILDIVRDLQNRVYNIEETLLENVSLQKELLTQSKVVKESKVLLQQVQTSVARMTGQDTDEKVEEIAAAIPISTVDAVMELEEKLKNKEFVEAMTSYLYLLKGASEDAEGVMKQMFTDELLTNFNWDGRWEKRAFKELKLVDAVLFDVFKKRGRTYYEQMMKRCISKSHHRQKQRKFVNKQKNLTNNEELQNYIINN